MQEFLLLFRRSNYNNPNTTPEQVQAFAAKWQQWAADLAKQDAVVAPGQRLTLEGKVLKPGGVITDGPFVEVREILGGFMIIRAASLDDATTLAHGCPVIEDGGCVEVRPLIPN